MNHQRCLPRNLLRNDATSSCSDDCKVEAISNATSTVANFRLSETDRFNWQGSKSSVRDRVGVLFNNEKMADVFFIVGNERERIPAHKLLLSISSVVLNAMFNGNLAATNMEIELPDVEPAAFLVFLRYLYTDEVCIDEENVITTLYTAKKYAVETLETHCVNFLRNNLSPDNAFVILAQAKMFDEPELESMCLKVIDKNPKEALEADSFVEADLDTLCAVLRRNSLRIKEIKLFHAVLRWSKAECQRQRLEDTGENRRKVLGRAFRLIRFPLMSIDEFAVGPAKCGILTDKEVISLFCYFVIDPKPSVEFNDEPRTNLFDNELVVHRFQEVEQRWGYNGSQDRIRFAVDIPISVIGLGLYGSVTVAAEYNIKASISQTSTNRILASISTSFSSDGSMYIHRVMFDEAVPITPNSSYTISVTIVGPDSYYGTKGLAKVSVDTPIGRGSFRFAYASGNNNGSSVEDGQIPQILFCT